MRLTFRHSRRLNASAPLRFSDDISRDKYVPLSYSRQSPPFSFVAAFCLEAQRSWPLSNRTVNPQRTNVKPQRKSRPNNDSCAVEIVDQRKKPSSQCPAKHINLLPAAPRTVPAARQVMPRLSRVLQCATSAAIARTSFPSRRTTLSGARSVVVVCCTRSGRRGECGKAIIIGRG